MIVKEDAHNKLQQQTLSRKAIGLAGHSSLLWPDASGAEESLELLETLTP